MKNFRSRFTLEVVDIWTLTPGTAIRIAKPFSDYHKQQFAAGTVLHFKTRNYLPYHSGHTVYFEEATMYLCDLDETAAIVQNHGHEYWAPV